MVDITRLPYESENGQFAMYLFTDSENADREFVKKYLLQLSDAELRKITNFGEYEGDDSYDQVMIRFPKFEFKSLMKMPEMLKKAGIVQAFEPSYEDGTPNLDFAKIADPEENGQAMYLGNVIQSTFIKVDESGTEAAAATASMMMVRNALVENEPVVKRVTADSPFGYVIKDETNNVVLFMGFVDDLSEIGQPVE